MIGSGLAHLMPRCSSRSVRWKRDGLRGFRSQCAHGVKSCFADRYTGYAHRWSLTCAPNGGVAPPAPSTVRSRFGDRLSESTTHDPARSPLRCHPRQGGHARKHGSPRRHKGINVLVLREASKDWLWKATIKELDAIEIGLDIHHIFRRKWCTDQKTIEPGRYDDAAMNDLLVSHAPFASTPPGGCFRWLPPRPPTATESTGREGDGKTSRRDRRGGRMTTRRD